MRHANSYAQHTRLKILLPAVFCLPFLTSGDDRPSRLDQVMERGYMTLLTRNGASSYFLGAEGETGPEYELVRAFSRYMGIGLKVQVADAFSNLANLLETGQGELIAANLTRTPSRERAFRFGPDYNETRIEVVYRRGQSRPRSMEDLVGLRVAVISGSSYEELLQQASASVEGLEWESLPQAGMEDLLMSVAQGEIDATLVDSSIFGINRPFYPRLETAFALEQPQTHAWAFQKDNDDSLVQRANQFLALARDNGEMAAIQERFHRRGHKLDQVGMHQFLKQVRARLPRFMPLFQEIAEAHDIDWRLLAAIGYQESHWDPEASSPTGVRGLMMLTQNTARQLGLRDRTDPEQSIEGGARYFLRMWKRIPERIQEPDRTWMALAAYNMGWGHLEDTRVLTQRQGGNPDLWRDVRERLPLLSQERYYAQAKYGYARGLEAQRYVRNIRNYFDILVWMDTRAHPMLVASASHDIPPDAIAAP